MPALADSNVILRSLQRAHPMHVEACRAIRILRRRGELFIAPQNIVELWVAATRPVAQNGLGVRPQAANVYLKAHDARLVASMLVHGLDTVLTFNVDDINRYTAITTLHPGSVK